MQSLYNKMMSFQLFQLRSSETGIDRAEKAHVCNISSLKAEQRRLEDHVPSGNGYVGSRVSTYRGFAAVAAQLVPISHHVAVIAAVYVGAVGRVSAVDCPSATGSLVGTANALRRRSSNVAQIAVVSESACLARP